MSRLLCGWALAIVLLAPLGARADYHIFSPYEIDLGELEIEHNGDAVFDRRRTMGGAQSYTSEFGTGLTPWWHSEIEFGFNRSPGDGPPTPMTQIVTENTFQLTEPGEAWADLGLYAEYGQTVAHTRGAGSNEVTFGPLVAKDWGRTTHTLNLFFTLGFGPDVGNHGFDVSYGWQSRWNLWAPLSPAIEAYGDTGTLGATPRFSQQQLIVGPVALGTLPFQALGLGRAGRLKYELGWLFGATPASGGGTLRWRLELEIPF